MLNSVVNKRAECRDTHLAAIKLRSRYCITISFIEAMHLHVDNTLKQTSLILNWS